MKFGEKTAVILLILSTVGVIVSILLYEKHRRARLFTVELIARAPEHGNWYPREIHVKRGQKTRLFIRNIETVSHGFAIPELRVAAKEIKAGHVAILEFTPETKGTFAFLCTVWCSDRHMEMTGKILVE